MATLALVAGSAKVCDVGRIVSLRFDVDTPGSYFEPYMGAAPTLTDGTRTITLVPLGVTHDVSGGKLQWDCYFEVPISENHITAADAATWTLAWSTALASDGTHNTPATGSVSVSNTSVVGADWLKSFTGTPAATYYVRPSGNDNNNGSNGAPWRTLSKARQVCNASHNGQYVVVNVDGGNYSATGDFTTIAGLANRSPILFKATGTGGQPVLDVTGDGGISWGTNHSVSNVTFDGFRIECGGGASGISMLGSSLGGVWFQRCSVQAKGSAMFGNLASVQYAVASSVDHTGLALRGVRFHLCTMCDALGHHGQGDYGYRAPTNRFTACIIDHAGFEVLAGGAIRRSTYGHTQYRHGGNEGLQCYMCTFTRSGCNGFSSNSKAAVFIRCMSFSNPCGIHLRGMGHNGAFLCVVEDGQDTNNGADPAPYGIGCQINIKWPNNDPVGDPNITDGPATLRLCAFINKTTGVGNSPGIEIQGNNAVSRRLMLDSCIIKDWGTGKGIVLTGGSGTDVVHVRNCSVDMRSASGERTCLEWQTPAIPNNWRFSGTNRYITGGVAKFRRDGVVVSDATYLALDPGAVFTAPVYPDGTRSFPRYCSEILGLADVSAFYAAIRTMSVLAFDVRYCQAAYWVLAGLTDLVEDPIDAGGPTLTPEREFTDPNGDVWTSGDVAYTQNPIKFGENVSESVRLRNKGTGTMHGLVITFGGSVSGGGAPFPDEFELAPGQSVDVPIVLLCQTAGAKSGTVTFSSAQLDDDTMTITWTVPSGVLDAPTNVRATAGNAAASVACDAKAGATGYKVLYGTTNGSAYNTTISSAGPNIAITGLTNGTTYYAVMRAVNAQGDSANSAQVSFTPAAPSGQGPLGSIKGWLIAGVRSVTAKLGLGR